MQYIQRITPTEKVEAIIKSHLRQRSPFSLIRVNDGENRFLGHNIFGNLIPSWFAYTGVKGPDPKARNALLKAIKEADMVGLSTNNKPNFRPLAEKILDHYRLNPKQICKGFINIELYENGAFDRILPGTRIVLIGSTLQKVAGIFKRMGATVVGTEAVHGFEDINRSLNSIKRLPRFDLALVSAGIPAKTICVEIRKTMGKVALDIGHVPEYIMYPNEVYLNVIRRYLKKTPRSAGRR